MSDSERDPIPNHFHFVFGLRDQTEPFHLFHYLALESCRRVMEPDEMHLYYMHLPYGPYWDLIRPHLEIHTVELAAEVLAVDPTPDAPAEYRYAHHADVIRLDVLVDRGGVYADIDTLFVSPFPANLFLESFVIGDEGHVFDPRTGEQRRALSNALMMAEPGAAFAQAWRDRVGAAMDGHWNSHSTFLPAELADATPTTVHVEPSRTFLPYSFTRRDLRAVFEELHTDTDGICSIHLWEHLWWSPDRTDFSPIHHGVLTESHIRTVDTTFNMLARPYLPGLPGP